MTLPAGGGVEATATETDVAPAVEALRGAGKLLLTTHEGPDGDALGSLLAMHWIVEHLGKDSAMYMSPEEFPLPHEYRWMPFDGLLGAPPDDLDERTVVFLDCGNIDRMPVDFLQGGEVRIVNIDHHHDNTRFGSVNVVVPSASCTAEIVLDIARELGAEITPPIAEALYVALVTDTGRFMYENTTAASHRMAAGLIDAGADTHALYRRLFEDLPYRRLELLGRALARVTRYDDGALTLAYLERRDFEETHALDTDSEGIIDQMRAVEGTLVAALIRELRADGRRGRHKVSLRGSGGSVDVSAIARTMGGGGHRRAAGFTTELELPQLIERIRAEVRDQLS